MAPKFYKNDYKIQKDLKDFANTNPIGRALKPYLKWVYLLVNPYLPYPRDFLVRMMKRDSVAGEIGTYNGIFAERIVRIGKPKKLYLIDPWKGIPDRTEEKYSQKAQDIRHNTVAEKFESQITRGQVVIVRKTSDDAVLDFPNDFFDFLYIDGDHSYKQVVLDLQNYYPKVKKGGLLCGDDYHIDEVRQAVDQFAKEKGLTVTEKNRQFMIRL